GREDTVHRSLRSVLVAAAFVLPALVPTLARANGWELGLAGIGVQKVQITKCATGDTQTIWSHNQGAGTCNRNLLISFDTIDGADTVLAAGTRYVITFLDWGKSAEVIGTVGTGNNDDVYVFTNSSSPPTLASACNNGGVQTVDDWPNASACLGETVVIDHTTTVGNKTT